MDDIMAFENLSDSQQRIIMRTNVIQLNNDVQKMKKFLFEGEGNDELPAAERLRNLETFQKTINFWFRTIAVAIVLQTITFGTVAVVALVRVMPALDKLANP